MKILILNQCFYPDVVSTAQHAADLAAALAAQGHEVSVIASRRAYDDPAHAFAAQETWQGVGIHRVWSSAFGKSAKWRRAADFASFFLSCSWKLLFFRRQDVVIAMTSPPLISFLAALFTTLRGGAFLFWVMDLNPDEAIAAGWLQPDSATGRTLKAVLQWSLDRASSIVVLDRFMKQRILAKNVPEQRIRIVPPWSHDEHLHYDLAGRAAFRNAHGLNDKFVVMYSGNHSPCHPLDSLLEAARQLAADPGVAFCFIGGGSEFKKVIAFREKHRLANITTLPYQPIDRLSASLSAADMHVVALGDPFVGIVHPCKIYNVMALGIPVLYIGPAESHIADMLTSASRDKWLFHARHGNPAELLDRIRVAQQTAVLHHRTETQQAECFGHQRLVPELTQIIESLAPRPEGVVQPHSSKTAA